MSQFTTLAFLGCLALVCTLSFAADTNLFDQAKANRGNLTVSTLLMAQDIDREVATDEATDKVIDWCRKTGVTRVYLETYRGRVTADETQLRRAKARFEAAGIDVSGCVTTTRIHPETKGKRRDCYADPVTRKRLAEIFAYTASIFDKIMIDDFFFTNCECPTCKAGKGAGGWDDYRTALMAEVSRDFVLGPARKVNPDVKITIKFPNWFDDFQNFGYDVVGQTALFDRIWAGTETREPDNPKWGAVQQYRAFFVMRWISAVGGAKTGGGWFDEIETGPDAYIEQARQTVLGGAKEMVLFRYPTLNRPQRDEHVKRLRAELPTLFELARRIKDQSPRGIFAVKPPNSASKPEYAVFEFLGMLGLPIVPATEIPAEAKAVFLPLHVADEPDAARKIAALIDGGATVLVTDGLLAKLPGKIDTDAPNVHVLEVGGDPYSLLKWSDERVAELRKAMMTPLGMSLEGPQRVAIYSFGPSLLAVESFRDEPADVAVRIDNAASADKVLALPAKAAVNVNVDAGKLSLHLSPRSLVLLRLN